MYIYIYIYISVCVTILHRRVLNYLIQLARARDTES